MTNKAPRTPPGKAKGKVRLIDANAIKFKKLWWRNPDGEEFEWEIADRGDIDNEPTVDILLPAYQRH